MYGLWVSQAGLRHVCCCVRAGVLYVKVMDPVKASYGVENAM